MKRCRYRHAFVLGVFLAGGIGHSTAGADESLSPAACRTLTYADIATALDAASGDIVGIPGPAYRTIQPVTGARPFKGSESNCTWGAPKTRERLGAVALKLLVFTAAHEAKRYYDATHRFAPCPKKYRLKLWRVACGADGGLVAVAGRFLVDIGGTASDGSPIELGSVRALAAKVFTRAPLVA